MRPLAWRYPHRPPVQRPWLPVHRRRRPLLAPRVQLHLRQAPLLHRLAPVRPAGQLPRPGRAKQKLAVNSVAISGLKKKEGGLTATLPGDSEIPPCYFFTRSKPSPEPATSVVV